MRQNHYFFEYFHNAKLFYLLRNLAFHLFIIILLNILLFLWFAFRTKFYSNFSFYSPYKFSFLFLIYSFPNAIKLMIYALISHDTICEKLILLFFSIIELFIFFKDLFLIENVYCLIDLFIYSFFIIICY